MKNIVIKALAVLMFVGVIVSCWKEDYPTEATPRPEVQSFEAIAGDEEIQLSWTPAEGSSPTHYIITYDENQEKQTLTTTETTYVIANLQNNVEYTVNLQAVYKGDYVSNMVSKTATPKTTRFPVTVFNVESGNGYVDLTWEKPHDSIVEYELTYWVDNSEPTVIKISKDKLSYRLDGLRNVTIYNLSFAGVYAKGASEPIVTIAMPCEFAPYTVQGSRIVIGRPVTFVFNTADYPSATDIKWSFGSDILTGAEVKYAFYSSSLPEIKLSVKLNGEPLTWPVLITVPVERYVFDFQDFADSGDENNGFYSSTPVFSPDRKTAYQITTNNTTLYAMDLESGTKKWSYPTSEASKFSASVNPVTGDILFGTAVAGGYYCVTAEGNLKWKASTTDGFSECGPAAISKDGSMVYVGDVSGTLYAISTADGSIVWKQSTGGGLTGGVLINGDEILYGNNTKVYFVKASDGSIISEIEQQMWKTTGFAVSPDRKYAYLSCRNGAKLAQSIARINLETKQQDKVLQIGADNTWGIAISPSGLVFAGNKDGSVYCADADLSAVKWTYAHKTTSGDVMASAFNFSHPVADNEGNFIISTQANDKKSLSITYMFEGATGNIKRSWNYEGDALGDGKNYSQQAGNNLIDGYFFNSYNSTNTNAGPFLCEYIGVERGDAGWASIGGDIFNSNCIK